MKKLVAVMMTLAALSVGAFASGGSDQQKASDGTAPAAAKSFKVDLVTDIGGIDDKSFNQSTWEGIVRFAKDFNLKQGDYKYLQSSAEADYIPNLATFSDEKPDLIVAPGFLFEKSMTDIADKYPNNKYLIIDTVVPKPNVVSAMFAAHEGSYLAGVAAGLKAKADGKNVVGFLGGMQFPLIEAFQAGFEQGVKAVYPDCKILIDYAGDFGAPIRARPSHKSNLTPGPISFSTPPAVRETV